VIQTGQTRSRFLEIHPIKRKRIALGIRIAQRRAELAVLHHVNTRGEPLDFTAYPYLEALYGDPTEFIVLQTGAQSGKTEFLVCDAMAVISLGIPYQLVQPKDDIRALFMGTRIKSLQTRSEYYKGKLNTSGNLIHWKGAEGGTLRVTFSNRQDEMLSFPADCIGVDERDVCNLNNIVELSSRQLQSEFRIQRHASTPRVPGEETINALYNESDRKIWVIVCRECDREQPLDWFTNIVEETRDSVTGELRDAVLRDADWTPRCGRDIRPLCVACAKPLIRLGLGRWKKQNPAAMPSGYHLNKLSSPRVDIAEMYNEYRKSKFHPKRMQTFCNSYLGLPYAGSGDKITEELLDRCASDVPMEIDALVPISRSDAPCSMGVDVGPASLDVRISCYPHNSDARVAAYIGKVKDFTKLYDMVNTYRVSVCVIDAEPETRKTSEFQQFLKGRCLVVRCYERRVLTVSDALENPEQRAKARQYGLLTIDRTFMMDSVQASFARRKNVIPKNWRYLSNQKYLTEMTTPTRVYEVDPHDGKPCYTWTHGNDHSFHADLFDLVASQLGNFLSTGMAWASGANSVFVSDSTSLLTPENSVSGDMA